jgi:hypothetical protein
MVCGAAESEGPTMSEERHMMSDAARTTRRKIVAFLDGAITKGTETTPREILSMLALLLVFILVYAWLEEIQAFVGHPFG